MMHVQEGHILLELTATKDKAHLWKLCACALIECRTFRQMMLKMQLT